MKNTETSRLEKELHALVKMRRGETIREWIDRVDKAVPKLLAEDDARKQRRELRYGCMWQRVGEQDKTLLCGACQHGEVTPTVGERCDNCGATVDQVLGRPPFVPCPKVTVTL